MISSYNKYIRESEGHDLYKILKTYIEKGSDPESTKEKMLRVLSHGKVDVNQENGFLLRLACSRSSVGAVSALLQQPGIDVNVKNGDPINYVIAEDSGEDEHEILEMLIDHGAYPFYKKSLSSASFTDTAFTYVIYRDLRHIFDKILASHQIDWQTNKMVNSMIIASDPEVDPYYIKQMIKRLPEEPVKESSTILTDIVSHHQNEKYDIVMRHGTFSKYDGGVMAVLDSVIHYNVHVLKDQLSRGFDISQMDAHAIKIVPDEEGLNSEQKIDLIDIMSSHQSYSLCDDKNETIKNELNRDQPDNNLVKSIIFNPKFTKCILTDREITSHPMVMPHRKSMFRKAFDIDLPEDEIDRILTSVQPLNLARLQQKIYSYRSGYQDEDDLLDLF